MGRRCWTLRLLLLILGHNLLVVNQAGSSPADKTIRIGYLTSLVQDGGAINVAIEKAQDDGLLIGYNFRLNQIRLLLGLTNRNRQNNRTVIMVVCLSVSNFAQKLPNGFAWNYQGMLAVVQGTNDWILVAIWIPSGHGDCFPDSSLLGDTESSINRLHCATLQCRHGMH